MPQLEQIHTYLSQVFWLVVTFGFLYLILWKTALPRISAILQEREERIDEDLRKAEQLKKEANNAVTAYEKLMAEARLEAQSIIRTANERLAVNVLSRQDELTEKIKLELSEAETRIEKARDNALESIQSVAIEVAQAATTRLTRYEVATTDAENAVISVMKGRE
ncbi:MAG: F0F1 ATP synthase subunit B' [Pseudomonadota bacterium]|nr:F0F1 ATP synthase subunit B' [Pseudomonadota bacterium]